MIDRPLRGRSWCDEPKTAKTRILAAPEKAGFVPDGVTGVGTIVFARIELIIPCRPPATMILTDQGEVAVVALVPGDLVMTRDSGLQPLRWDGRGALSALDLMADPNLQPVLMRETR